MILAYDSHPTPRPAARRTGRRGRWLLAPLAALLPLLAACGFGDGDDEETVEPALLPAVTEEPRPVGSPVGSPDDPSDMPEIVDTPIPATPGGG